MLPLPTIVSGAIALAAACAFVVDHGLARRTSAFLDRSVYRAPVDRWVVALTFDDGPHPQTLELLNYLDEEEIRATFFQVGMHAERHPDIVRRVYLAGHEIGNHAWSHAALTPSFRNGWRLPTLRSMYRELAQTQRLLTSLCQGHAPTLFRPPFGKRWLPLDAVQRRLGLRGIQWTVIGHDWEWPAQRIVEHILSRVTPGCLICLHDGRDVNSNPDITETLIAVRTLVPLLREKGYSFMTVSEMLASKPSQVEIAEVASPQTSKDRGLREPGTRITTHIDIRPKVAATGGVVASRERR